MAAFGVSILLLSIHFITYTSAFYNPIVAKGQDPSVSYYNDYYYLVQSVSDAIIVVMKSAKLENLGSPEENVTVWTGSGSLCCEVWAPELIYVDSTDRWYIYFAADEGNNNNHRSYALESAGNDPLGPYTFIGKMAAATDEWAIDATVMKLNNQLYYIWSGSPGACCAQQNLYIASLSSPTTFSTDRYLISEPIYQWEFSNGGYGINEGPEVLQHNGYTFIIYSASAAGEDGYCFGLLTYNGGDPLQQSSWAKSNHSVFSMDASKSVYGPGHNSFTTSPDLTEVWNVYHAQEQSNAGFGGRSIRAQTVNWNTDGTPNFGTPVGFSDWVDPPSGE